VSESEVVGMATNGGTTDAVEQKPDVAIVDGLADEDGIKRQLRLPNWGGTRYQSVDFNAAR